MRAEFITATDQRWQEFLAEVPHDFYHLPEYVTFASRHEGGQATAFLVRDGEAGMLIPLLLRVIPENLGAPMNWCDASSPYGYPTPLFQPATKPRQAESFLKDFIRCSGDLGIVTVFLRFHPLLPCLLHEFEEHGTVVHHGRTVWIDLRCSREDFWRNTRMNHRRGITKLRLAGFQARTDHWADLQGFVDAYGETMERIQAHSFYRFPVVYFRDLQAVLGEKLHLCSVVSPEGEVAAAGLFTNMDGLVQYHLGGTSQKYLDYAPSKLLFDHVRNWASDEGCARFHLGGGVGGQDDSLLRFKLGFSGLTADYHTCRMVINPTSYSFLNSNYMQSKDDSCPVNEEYFPFYRG